MQYIFWTLSNTKQYKFWTLSDTKQYTFCSLSLISRYSGLCLTLSVRQIKLVLRLRYRIILYFRHTVWCKCNQCPALPSHRNAVQYLTVNCTLRYSVYYDDSWRYTNLFPSAPIYSAKRN